MMAEVSMLGFCPFQPEQLQGLGSGVSTRLPNRDGQLAKGVNRSVRIAGAVKETQT